MSGPDIFISYAREDEGAARLFAEAFAQEGFNVWWDDALHSGETFDEVIEQELRAARAVVVLWSPHSCASRWVRAEATLADRNKTLAPAIIAPCNRPIIFELTHTADLSRWSGDIADGAWQAFVKDIRRQVEARKAAAADAPAPPPPAPAKRDGFSAPEAAQPQPAPGASNADLLSAVAALQEAIAKQSGVTLVPPSPAPAAKAEPEPAPEPEPVPEIEMPDESEATQFFTHSDAYDLMGAAELHCLELSIGDEVEQRFIVSPLGLKIGRTAPADVVLADSKVSRSHCMIELKDDELFVSDLNSTNGTYVDGQRISGAAILPVGSTLRVGHFSLVHEVRSRDDL